MKVSPRPVLSDALQWTGTNIDDARAFTASARCLLDATDDPPSCLLLTLSIGTVRLTPSDWIVKAPSGDIDVYTNDAFHAALVVVDE